MMQRLKHIWFKRRSRYLAVNLIVGAACGIVVSYVGYSIAINLFDFDFLFGPYGSPDRSSIFQFLDVEASDPRWLGMLKGAGNTIAVVVFAIFLSSMLGLAVGVARLSSNPMVNGLGKLYVDLFRNLPLLLIMFFFAFAVSRRLPKIEERSGWSGLLYISQFALVAVARGVARRRGRVAREEEPCAQGGQDGREPAPQCVGNSGLCAHRSGGIRRTALPGAPNSS